MERNARLSAMRRILETRRVSSQEDLQAVLQDEGFQVTQATLSRDLKYLKVGKVPDGQGGYVYAFHDGGSRAGSEKSLVQDFMRGFLSIEFTGVMGLIKTLPGHASSVAFALDNLQVEKVLGTIAGDDAILVLPRDGVTREEVLQAMEERIPGLSEGLL